MAVISHSPAPRRRLASAGLGGIALLSVALLSAAVPAGAGAQTAAPAAAQAPDSQTAQALSQDLLKTLQGIRPLDAPPAVPLVVQVKTIDGRSVMVPLTAAMGHVDLRLYEEQLKSLFPVSQTYYPADSITAIREHRGADWVSRLKGVPAAQQPYAVNGWQRVMMAEVAAAAANDTAARRLFDARIAELAKDPAQQSYAMFELIATLADPTQDSVRLLRNLALAEQYLKRLHALPASGYRTHNDSTSVLERQWQAEDTLAVAYTELDDTARVVEHAKKVWPYTTILGMNERYGPFLRSYYRMVTALAQTPEGRAQIIALTAPVKAMAHRVATEQLTANVPAEERARFTKDIEEDVPRRIEDVVSWLALLNTPAPPLAAHAWFNTADSSYATPPRTHALADGRVHMLMFGRYYENNKVSVLDRVQRSLPNVDVVFITNTNGSAGPDILGPKDETNWLSRYLLGLRHFANPYAVWAGSKVQVGYVPEGHYPVFRPEETPNEKPYHAGMLDMSCVLIDKKGMIRFYQDISTRKNERKLARRIQLLLDEATPAATSTAPVTPSSPHDHGTH